MKRIAVLLTAAVLAFGPAPAALAQGSSPFGPLPQAPPEETPTPEPVDTDPSDNDVSRETLVVILGSVVVLFVIIGWYITRDARRALPSDRGVDPLPSEEIPHRKPKAAKAKARQKAKAAKRARKVTKRGR